MHQRCRDLYNLLDGRGAGLFIVFVLTWCSRMVFGGTFVTRSITPINSHPLTRSSMEVSPRGHWSKSRVLYGGTLDNLGGGIVKKKLGGRHLKIVDMLDSN